LPRADNTKLSAFSGQLSAVSLQLGDQSAHLRPAGKFVIFADAATQKLVDLIVASGALIARIAVD
jgi:hypothetical protein